MRTRHVLDEQNVSMDLNDDWSTKFSFIRGVRLVGYIDGANGSKYFYNFNAHGDVLGAVGGLNSTAQTRYTYDAFGNASKTGSSANPFQYCGEYADDETGLIYLRARYYDPNAGRFISEDTYWSPKNMIYGDEEEQDNRIPNILAIKQSCNLYEYCIGNPIVYTDANGNRIVIMVVGEDSKSNNNAFANNAKTFKEDNPDDFIITLNAWEYDSAKELMDHIIQLSTVNYSYGIDALIIESHASSSSLIVSSRYSLGKNENWAAINFKKGANIRLTGCNSGGRDGVPNTNSIAQYIANQTKRNVYAYVNNTSQKVIVKNGRRKYYQKPVRMRWGQKVVSGYTQFTPR